MDYHKSKVLLKKINALHDSAEAFEGKFSNLEKDLILHYLRDLYEVLQADDVTVNAAAPAAAPPAPPVIQAHPVAQPTPVVAPVVQAPPPVQPVQAIVQKVQEEIAPVPVVEKPMVKVALDEPAVAIKQPAEVSAPMVAKKDQSSFNALFEDEQVKDVSSQFSLKPLADINKGMGINDKILMINALFAGDQQLFSASVDQMNKLSSFEEAKQVIVNGLATKNDWLSDQKIDTAKRFIHLIRRRYQ